MIERALILSLTLLSPCLDLDSHISDCLKLATYYVILLYLLGTINAIQKHINISYYV